MSAWGISNFENDSALGFVGSLIEEDNGETIDGIIKNFVSTFDPEDTTLVDCSRFLAVAEVLAGLLGSPSEDFPDEMTDWIETKYIKIEQDIIVQAKKGVSLILKDSEAKEMYWGSGYQTSWVKAQKDLLKRLSA
jgi:hypothetical protein|tara:strand:- start:771 stop:1175 length:405 start_codon:yes stop_codon:yes gene_type:complete